MSKFRGSHGDPGQLSERPKRWGSRWFLARGVVAGGFVAGSLAVGATGLAGVGAAAGSVGLAVPDLGKPAMTVAGSDVAMVGRDGEDPKDPPEKGGERDRVDPDHRDPADADKGRGHRGDHHAVSVPCDTDKLVAALVNANAEGGGTLRLAPKCTYTLTKSLKQPDEYDGGIRDAREAADNAENGGAQTPQPRPDLEPAGLPVIYHPITIKGEGATIERGTRAEAFRFFTVRDGGELKLSDVTLTNGRASTDGGSIYVVHGAAAVVERTTITHSVSFSPEGGGGAIFNDGHMIIKESRFLENSAAGSAGKGGGVNNGGVLAMERSEFRNNRANAYGGGFANFRGAADVGGSAFVHNHAQQGGGLASFSARSKVWDSKVVGNTAQTGGGLAVEDAILTLSGMTIRDNTAAVKGGGISAVRGLLPLDGSTVKGNTTDGNGGGIFADKSNVLLRKSEVSRNHAVGAASKGGGVFTTMGQLSLFKSKVTENDSTVHPGGIFADKAQVKVDDESAIIRNRPTNCQGSTVPIAHCFG